MWFISSEPCSKFLENDGISSRVFLLRGFDNKKIINFKDVKTLRNNIPSSGLAITVVKNFDEYQYIICGYIPKLNDNNFFKIKFSKDSYTCLFVLLPPLANSCGDERP